MCFYRCSWLVSRWLRYLFTSLFRLRINTDVVQLLYTGLTCPTGHIPGPWYTRFTHLRLKRAVVTGRRAFYIHALHQKYGPIVRLSPNEVGVADLDAFKEIHKIGSKYLKSTWYERLANFPKKGIFTMIDPKEYGSRRKLLSGSFSKSYLMTHWEDIIREKVHLCVSKIKNDAVAKGSADVYKWYMLLASDVTTHLAFGEPFGMLEAGRVSCHLPLKRASSRGQRSYLSKRCSHFSRQTNLCASL